MKTYIVPRRDYKLLKWLEPFGSKGVEITTYAKVMKSVGMTETEMGQFLNEYVAKGIFARLPDGKVRIIPALFSGVKYTYDITTAN